MGHLRVLFSVRMVAPSPPIMCTMMDLSLYTSSLFGGISPGRKFSLQVGNARTWTSSSQKIEVDSVSVANDSLGGQPSTIHSAPKLPPYETLPTQTTP